MSEEQDEGDELAEPSVEIPEVPDPVFTLETVDANAEHSEPTFSESGPHWEIIDETTGQDQPADSAVVTAEARGTADMAPGAEADPLPAEVASVFLLFRNALAPDSRAQVLQPPGRAA